MRDRLGVCLAAAAVAFTPAAVHRVPAAPTGVTITGVDLHDGMLAHYGGQYELYGTMYGCGFTWGQAGTPWCGFGVSTAPALAGPWSAPALLFSPTDLDPFTRTTFAADCSAYGAGCFNPRMMVRTWGPADDVPVLYFNAPADYTRNRSNAYYAMGCNTVLGPCGDAAGAPYGSTHKPALYRCSGNGDFTVVPAAPQPYMVCTMPGQTLTAERLTVWGTDGDGTGAANLGGLTAAESPGVYQDPGTGTWLMTYSAPNCGYCTGDDTGYAAAAAPAGPWTVPVNLGAAAPVTGRRSLSATSCGGQPRTVSVVDGVAYQGIDLWTGAANETRAGLRFEPLTYTPTDRHAGDGLPWRPPFTPWTCDD